MTISPAALDNLSIGRLESVEPVLPGGLLFAIPVADNEEIAERLQRPGEREELVFTLRLLERVHELSRASERNFIARLRDLAAAYRHRPNCSWQTLHRKWKAYVESGGNWRVLLKNYRAADGQPPEFVEFLRGLIEQNARSVSAACRALREDIWAEGLPVPGYGTWREWFAAQWPMQDVPERFPRVWPEGWHPRNLSRYKSSKAARLLFQRGLAAAHGQLPTLRRDTSRLRPLEWIVIDDFELDVMCLFDGAHAPNRRPQLAYVSGLMAMCVGTRKKLAWGLRPQEEFVEQQKDGTFKKRRRNLVAYDVQSLLFQIFNTYGLPDYTVTIVCENATASISPALELMLTTLFEGKIVVRRTSMIEHKTLANGFIERGGTPWEKGWIESEFNYLWNQFCTQSGYKGSNERLNAPGWFAEQKADALRLLNGGESKVPLPPELAAQLRTPFQSVEQLMDAFKFVVERSEQRTKHRMQGFDRVTEFCWPKRAELAPPEGIDEHAPNPFSALALLPPQQQAMMVPVQRMEAPVERFERFSLQHPRTALRKETLQLFLLQPNRAKWRRHAVTFTRDGAGYSYVDDENLLAGVPEGSEVLAYVDPADTSAALVTLADGRRIGTLRMLGNSSRGVDITDEEAVGEARARRAKIVNRVIAEVRSRPLHQLADARLAEDRAHNAAIVKSWSEHAPELTEADRLALKHSHVAAEQQKKRAKAKALQNIPELDPVKLL